MSKEDAVMPGTGAGTASAGADADQRARMQARLAASYQPMLRAVSFPTAAYFVFVTLAYLVIEERVGQILLGGSSIIVSLGSLAIAVESLRRILTYEDVERRGTVLFVLVYLNLLAHQVLHLEPAKLFFFALLILMVAIVGISTRLVLMAAVISSAAMMMFASAAGPEQQTQYFFIVTAASFSAFIMSSLTRRAITKEIQTSLTANELREAAEERAERDMLTGLPNRRSFFRSLEQRFKGRRGSAPQFALGIVDLDGFKAVNDTFGHAVGDQLLIEVAERLDTVCNSCVSVARLGGDEFALIVQDPKEDNRLIEFGGRIRAVIEKPYTIMGVPLTISASVGFMMDHVNIFTGSEMLERADYALYEAKKEKGGVVVYSPDLESERRTGRAVEHNLRYGDLENEMSVVFQPLVDIETGAVTGFEALARWENRELGKVRPDVFIRAAERTGMIGRLTPLLLRKALAAADGWPEGIKLSFNLSIRDIDTPSAVDAICQIVRESGFAPQNLAFEVTETLIMADYEQARASLRKLQDLGAGVALDDFGVGYANFSHIDQLNIDTIKIDGSFIARLSEPGNSGKILRTMIDMCANLGVGCVVEGVETQDELSVLKAMGARHIQGFLFSRPIPPEDIAAFLASNLAGRIARGPGAAGDEAQRLAHG